MTLDSLYRDVENLKQQYRGLAGGPQLALSSIENGSIDSMDADGNLKMTIGEQDDGGNTINVLAGPTPPTPTGFTVDVDHGKFILHWFGDFDGDALAPSDWSRAEVHASQDPFFVPSRTTARGSIVSAAGGEVTIGVLKGPWTIKMLAWSQAGKMSAPSAPVDVEVPGYGDIVLEEIDAAETRIENAREVLLDGQNTLGGKLDSAFGSIDTINGDLSDLDAAVQGAITSANGKNTVHFDDHAPGPEVEGVEGDTWFVGRVGRPNDVVEATNIVANSSLETDAAGWSPYSWTGSGSRTQGAGAFGDWFYRLTATSAITGLKGRYHDVLTTVKFGQKWTLSIHVRPSRTISLRPQGELRGPSGVVGSPQYGNYFACPAGEWTRIHMTITAVGDATTIRHQTYLHDATLQAGDTLDLDAEMIALGPLMPYFDGDTPSGETDNESHYRWTGEPHASTSEKYLPATEGLSDKWNVTEQYRHNGTGWEKVELSHSVISSVDIGALTVGSAAIKEAVVERLFADVVVQRMSVADEFIGENAIIEGAVTASKITASEELWAKLAQFVTVYAEMIESDAIDSMVITGPTIQSARSGQRWVGDQGGIRIIDDNEDVRTQLSPEGSTFKGEVEAETLVVNGGAELRSTENVLAQGAKLTLAAGVTDPTAPPVVQPYWESLGFTPLTLNGDTDYVGMAWDGASYITVGANKANAVAGFYSGVYAMKIDPTTGASTTFRCDFSAATPSDNRVSEVFGVTCIGSELFWYGRYGYVGYVWVTDLAGTFLRKFAAPDIGYSPANQLKYRPGIGNDGTNVVVSGCADSGMLNIQTVNKTTGARISYVEDTGGGTRSDITGVHVGNADWGRKLVTVAQKRTGELTSFSPTTGAYDGDGTKFQAATTGSVGVVFLDGKFHTLDPSGKIHEYANSNTGDASPDWWATYYWYTDVDDDSVIESSDHQSRMAPPSRFTWPRRAQLKILGQPMPEGVEALGPALAKKTSTPVRTDFSGPGWQVDAGKSSARYVELPTNWTTYGSPSATNTFPEAESSVLESASGTFRVQGDGSGYWGPLKMGRNGVMSGLIATGQVSCAVTTAGAPKKFTVQLPAGRFTKPPVVWLSPLTSSPQNVAVSVVGADITTTSFDLWFWRNDLSGTGVDWFAMDSE